MRSGLSRARRLTATAGALLALAAPAAACPYCALSQGVETLAYILGFLVIPYVVVSATWLWMRRIIARENEGQG